MPMENNYIDRHEFEQYAQRMEDEHARQNHRIAALEELSKQIATLASSVEKLAFSMQSMAKKQEQQGEKLEELESRDGEMWRKVTGYMVTTIAGIVVGFIFNKIGM